MGANVEAVDAESQWREALRGSGTGPWECGEVVMDGTLAEAIAARVAELEGRRAAIGRHEADHEAACRYAPYGDDRRVGEQSAALMVRRETVFQPHRFGAGDEASHVRRLLDFYALPPTATILDAGCGIGGVARHMSHLRPDLRFILLNNSRAQLTLCPPGFEKIHATFEDVPLAADSVDAVMFNFALGHANLARALAEAARLTRPGGLLLIADLCAEDCAPLVVTMGYNAHDARRIAELAQDGGYDLDRADCPRRVGLAPSIAVLGESIYRQIFGCVQSWMFRFTKCVLQDPLMPLAIRPAAVF